MKIVCVDNFGRANLPDALVAENIKSKTWAEIMVNALNEKAEGTDNWCLIKPDDYVLSRGMEDLV